MRKGCAQVHATLNTHIACMSEPLSCNVTEHVISCRVLVCLHIPLVKCPVEVCQKALCMRGHGCSKLDIVVEAVKATEAMKHGSVENVILSHASSAASQPAPFYPGRQLGVSWGHKGDAGATYYNVIQYTITYYTIIYHNIILYIQCAYVYIYIYIYRYRYIHTHT